jgi:hypothetical protein
MKRQQSEPMKAKTSLERKPYSTPLLEDWGTIQDLTQGLGGGGNDLPKKGGSRPL